MKFVRTSKNFFLKTACELLRFFNELLFYFVPLKVFLLFAVVVGVVKSKPQDGGGYGPPPSSSSGPPPVTTTPQSPSTPSNCPVR